MFLWLCENRKNLFTDLCTNHSCSQTRNVSVTTAALLPEGVVGQIFAEVNVRQLAISQTIDVHRQIIVPVTERK